MTFELNKRNIALIVVLVLLIITGGILYNYRYPSVTKKINNKPVLLNDYSRFFTVSNCADIYINYLAKKDQASLYLLLSEEYKEIKNITKSNILDKLEKLSGDTYDFEARKIYTEDLSKTMVKYYVYGYLKEVLMDEYIKPTDYYLIVIMDTKNFTYSITPYNGEIFKEAE